MQEAQEGFNLAVWFSKLTIRDWLVGVVFLLILIGPGLFGKAEPAAPAPPPPEPVPTPGRWKRSSRPKRK